MAQGVWARAGEVLGSLAFRRECFNSYVERAARNGVWSVAADAVECEKAAAAFAADGERELAMRATVRASEARRVAGMTVEEIGAAVRASRRSRGK